MGELFQAFCEAVSEVPNTAKNKKSPRQVLNSTARVATLALIPL
jgi:hypothetical protein